MEIENKNKKGEKKLYAVGQEHEGNYQHLGKKDKKDLKESERVHLLGEFDAEEILDFAAAKHSTIVLIAGPGKNMNEGLYQHELPDGTKSHGLIHFYKKAGNWVFLPAEQYEAKKAELPAVCFAAKCPLKDIDSKQWPELDKIEAMLQKTGDEHDVNCALTGKKIVGPRYYTRYMANTVQVELSLSEAGVQQDNQHSLNPQVFLRLTRPLLQDKELPQLDPADFYDAKPGTSLSFECEPELRWVQNSALLKKTSDQWNSVKKVFEQFPADKECTGELLRKMEELTKESLKSAEEIKDVDFKNVFKVSDVTFENEKLKGLSDNVKMQRAELLWSLNVTLSEAMVFWNRYLTGFDGTLTQNVLDLKDLIIMKIKTKMIQKAIEQLPRESSKSR